jgi:hypothetical protein
MAEGSLSAPWYRVRRRGQNRSELYIALLPLINSRRVDLLDNAMLGCRKLERRMKFSGPRRSRPLPHLPSSPHAGEEQGVREVMVGAGFDLAGAVTGQRLIRPAPHSPSPSPSTRWGQDLSFYNFVKLLVKRRI